MIALSHLASVGMQSVCLRSVCGGQLSWTSPPYIYLTRKTIQKFFTIIYLLQTLNEKLKTVKVITAATLQISSNKSSIYKCAAAACMHIHAHT